MTVSGDGAKVGLPTDETELLLHYLATHDAVCPLCKYNLRNLTVARCPECGRSIRLAVGLVEQVLWPYVMLLVGLVAPAGMGVLAIVGTAVEGRALYNDIPKLGVVSLISLQLMVLPAAGALIFRRRFLRLTIWTQRILGIGAVVLAVLLYGFFILAACLQPH